MHVLCHVPVQSRKGIKNKPNLCVFVSDYKSHMMSGENINKSELYHKLMLLLSLDVPVGRRGELGYLDVQFLVGPVLCNVVQVTVKIHQ